MKLTKEKTFHYLVLKYLKIAYLILFLIFSFYLARFFAPLHESLHALVCFAYKLNPVINPTSVNCEGIQYAPNIIQFFYTMLPYIFWSFILVIFWTIHNKSKFLKYFTLVPAMDVFINFWNSAFIGGDFRQLAAYTNDALIFFYIGGILVGFVLLVTINLLKKTQVLNILTFTKDFNIDFKK